MGNLLFSFHYSLSYWPGHLLVCKSKNLGSWVSQLMIQFIVLSSFFLQDYISFIFFLDFFFVVFCGCSFLSKIYYFTNLRVSEVLLFYNLQLFYWHFLEILWLFIFLVFYSIQKKKKKKKKKS